jgi:hypothetical protein
VLTLYVDTPLFRAQAERLERSFLTQPLRCVNMLVAAVVSCAGISFRVFVCAELSV